MTSLNTASLMVPAPVKGHRHRRSAAISLDWRHVALPPTTTDLSTKPVNTLPASYSPTLTFASTLSDTSVEEEVEAAPPLPSTQVSVQSPTPKKRVAFLDDVEEIPGANSGDTWLKPEDYSWPISSTDSKTVLLDPMEPSIDLAPANPTIVPGSPVLMHRKKRSSFLQSTKNALTRRPSKKGHALLPQSIFDVPVPAPKSCMIDLDLALAPNSSLRHKKSGSLGNFSGLPASPSKPKSWHKRADSAPADIVFSFSPRPASPDSRKRKMSSIVEHPTPQTTAGTLVKSLDPVTDMQPSHPRPTGIAQAMTDDMIIGEPGDMVSTEENLDSPAVAALKSHSGPGLSRKGSRKGWRGVIHRLLH